MEGTRLPNGTLLLVSVRNATEARAALAGGADVIDVKEPNRGPLGWADKETIAEVLAAVDGARPVSVALGELRLNPLPPWQEGLGSGGLLAGELSHLHEAGQTDEAPAAPLRRGRQPEWMKVGLSGWGGTGWAEPFGRLAAAVAPTPLVPAAYADAERAKGPAPLDVVPELARLGVKRLLVDTFLKDGQGLLAWQSLPALRELARRCRDADIALALAGGLTAAAFEALLPLRPAILAVRGAACADGQRGAAVVEAQVRRLKGLLMQGAQSTSVT